MQFVFPTKNLKRYRFPTHINDLVVDRADAETSEVFVVVLAPGEAPPLHQHDDTEQIFYILSGQGVLRIGVEQKKFLVRVGDVVRIPPRTLHSIRCQGKKPLHYLAVDCFVGGRPEAEPTWDSHALVMCENNGWNYDQVVQKNAARINVRNVRRRTKK
jgi:mannose-6-phosphate isomerase-like protein (cupin superfamily)